MYYSKNFILDVHVGMEKQQKQELGWRVSVLPIPAFHVILHVPSIAYSEMQEWVIQIPSIPVFHPYTSRIKNKIFVTSFDPHAHSLKQNHTQIRL